MIVDDAHPALPTPSQTVGPFFHFGLDWHTPTELVPAGHPEAVTLAGRVTDGHGDPVPDAVIEIWQADALGRFPPDTAPDWTGFGRCLTDADGAYRFTTVVPGAVPQADGRVQAPHIDVSVFARGLLNRLVTRVYFAGEAANGADPVLASVADAAARATLVAGADGSGHRFDIRLQGDGETVFFAW